MARRWSVPTRTMSRWVGPIVARHRDVRNVQIKLLSDAGWTQQRIGDEVGVPRETVRNALADLATWPDRPSTDLVSAAVDGLTGQAHDAAAEVAVKIGLEGNAEERRVRSGSTRLKKYVVAQSPQGRRSGPFRIDGYICTSALLSVLSGPLRVPLSPRRRELGRRGVVVHVSTIT